MTGKAGAGEGQDKATGEAKPKRIGRPPVWTPERKKEAQATICRRIAEGEGVATMCRDKSAGLPDQSTVWEWLANDASFAEMYARARETQADTLADQLLAVADRQDIDPARLRIMVDTRKWIAAKLKPRSYGDKLDVTASVTVSADEAAGRLSQVLGVALPPLPGAREGDDR
jgi:hypothetical protein